jgi:hypothetical protein
MNLFMRQVSASGVKLFYSKGLDLYSTGSVTFQGFRTFPRSSSAFSRLGPPVFVLQRFLL